MNKRELLLCALNREENTVPVWPMGFENLDTAKRLVGEENVPLDIPPEYEYKKGAANEQNMMLKIKFAEQVDSCVIGVGKGGSFSHGHGGPGEFMEKLVDKGENYCISIYETGVKREVKTNPHFFRYFDHQGETEESFERLEFPNALDASRYVGIKEEVAFFKQKGYFTTANINGFFSGLHYFLCPYDKILLNFLLEPEFVHKMMKKLGEFNLNAAESLLKCGVDSITFCDDMGSGNNLLFSPTLYEEFFFPWHKELADLCHSYGAYAHMHSHGNINKIMGRIVDAGIDMLNPCDPYENMDLKALKAEYGNRITFVGGVDKFFFEWDRDTMARSLKNVIETGRKGGGYVFMDSSGSIPENVPKETFEYYMSLSKELRA